MEIGIPFSNVVGKWKKEMEVLSQGGRLSTRIDHVLVCNRQPIRSQLTSAPDYVTPINPTHAHAAFKYLKLTPCTVISRYFKSVFHSKENRQFVGRKPEADGKLGLN